MELQSKHLLSTDISFIQTVHVVPLVSILMEYYNNQEGGHPSKWADTSIRQTPTRQAPL